MLTFTITPSEIKKGVVINEYHIEDKTLIGIDVGNFTQKKIVTNTPKIFTIKHAKAADVVTAVKIMTKRPKVEGQPFRLCGAIVSKNPEESSDKAIVYFNVKDAESKFKVHDGKDLYLNGNLFEGTIEGTVEHTNKDGITYYNHSRPCVLLIEKDKEYTIDYNEGNVPVSKVISFNGTDITIVKEFKRIRPCTKPVEKTPTPVGIISMAFDTAFDNANEKRKQRRNNSWEHKHKEDRWN